MLLRNKPSGIFWIPMSGHVWANGQRQRPLCFHAASLGMLGGSSSQRKKPSPTPPPRATTFDTTIFATGVFAGRWSKRTGSGSCINNPKPSRSPPNQRCQRTCACAAMCVQPFGVSEKSPEHNGSKSTSWQPTTWATSTTKVYASGRKRF